MKNEMKEILNDIQTIDSLIESMEVMREEKFKELDRLQEAQHEKPKKQNVLD